jgi:DNA polymerase III epsilon subunit-like protein
VNGKENEVFRNEEVFVKQHERQGKPISGYLSHRLKKVFSVGSNVRKAHGDSLREFANDTEFVDNPYAPELLIAGREPFEMEPKTGHVYGRRPSREEISAAVAEGIPDAERNMFELLAGTATPTDEQIEKYVYARRSINEDLLNVYVSRGYSLNDMEALAKFGGEPPELVGNDTTRFPNKWTAWELKRSTVKFPDANFIKGQHTIPIEGARFAVMDFETTGGSADEGNRVIEIGILVVDSEGRVLDRLDTLIDPQDAKDRVEDFTKIHMIQTDDVEGAPTFFDVYPEITRVLNGCVIVAQNKAFEEEYLSHEFARVSNKQYVFPSLCTVDLARRFVGPATPNHKLGTMAEHFGLDLGNKAHMASADTKVTAQMLTAYLRHARNYGYENLYCDVPVPTISDHGPVNKNIFKKREH